MTKKLRHSAGSSVGWIAAGIILFFVLVALFAPLLAPYGENEQNLIMRLKPPVWADGGSDAHLLGTDELGRDVLTRLVYGARASIAVGVLTVVVSGMIGIVMGLFSGYFPKLDAVLMRIADVQLAFPSMLLALALIAVIGGGFLQLIMVLGISGWVSFARVIRSETLSIKSADYVMAAQTAGVRTPRILLRHIFPNILAPAVTIGTFQVASSIISEASLSFLGLGIPPTTATWGNMLQSGKMFISSAWWLALLPGLCIVLIVLSINIMGDVLRDYTDPHIKAK
ncbi:MAG: ABC transporter permease [Clostridiales bacterium]|nr:ABC transporter permease [Clostridiales bacterium]